MPRLSVELAGSSDDAAVRGLLAETPMPGPIRVAFTREPSIFAAMEVAGRHNEVIVVRDVENGRIVGAGTRSIKSAYLNGVVTPLGYLGNLRLLDAYRGSLVLARGYQFLRRLHEDDRAVLYLTTITEDNRLARRILTSGRGGLPAYRAYGRLQAVVIDLRQRAKHVSRAFELHSASPEYLSEIVEFLRTEGSAKQFFPAYTAEDFQAEGGLLRGLHIDDVLLCRRRGRLAGVCAGWDQSAFRQYVVTGYHPALATLRPLYNLIARAVGSSSLLPPGSSLNCVTLALVCVRDNDPDVAAAMVARMIERHRSRQALLIAGLHERDPLLAVLRRYRHRSFLSRVYVVHWPDGAARFAQLDQRIPYLELASL